VVTPSELEAPGWHWAVGETSPPGKPLARILETALWILACAAAQAAAARLGAASWAAPDFAILFLLAMHWLWGAGGAAAALALGILADGLGGLPAGLTLSGYLMAVFVIEWMRGAVAGGLGGLWLGPAGGAALASALWRAVLWGGPQGAWPNPLDLLAGVLLTMAAAALAAAVRNRLTPISRRRLRMVRSASLRE